MRRGVWLSGLVAGLLAGVVVGWVVRGTLGFKENFVSVASGVPLGTRPPELSQEIGRSPFVIQAPTSSAKPAPAKPEVKKAAEVVPAPTKLPGSLPAVGPAPVGAVAPVDSVSGDLHHEEAQVRVIAGQFGGLVVSVHDAKGAAGASARRIEISLGAEKAGGFRAAIIGKLGRAAMIEDPVTAPRQESSPELRAAESELDSLKARVHQAQLDFYPDAPALKTLQAQYADQLKRVQELRARVNLPVIVTIVLTSG